MNTVQSVNLHRLFEFVRVGTTTQFCEQYNIMHLYEQEEEEYKKKEEA